MRNPNRIPEMLEAVQKIWEKTPDWRLGQLIENLCLSAGYEDAFFVEDDRLLEEIKKLGGEQNAQETYGPL